jgi:hypothetical protein
VDITATKLNEQARSGNIPDELEETPVRLIKMLFRRLFGARQNKNDSSIYPMF